MTRGRLPRRKEGERGSLSSTIRRFAASRLVYATALLALVNYARGHDGDFTFGPLDLAALESQGLAVSGRPGRGHRGAGEDPGPDQDTG